MRKHMSAWIVIISFAISPMARADTGPEIQQEELAEENTPERVVVSPQEPYGDLEETYEADEDENPYGNPVSTSTNSAEQARKKEFWRNIILASVAVVVAVVSILVVSNNNGHS